MNTAFEWPTLPYFANSLDQEHEPEICVVYLRTGKKVLGELIDFCISKPEITFKANTSVHPETINLNQIKSIRLISQLAIKKEQLNLADHMKSMFPPADKQSFKVELYDHETICGDTMSYADVSNGFYFFSPVGNGNVVRSFIPRCAIKTYQIGNLIGDVLVAHNLVSKDHVEEALERQHKLRMQRIGDYLSENQIISREQLELAISHQEGKPILKLGEALIQLQLLTEEQLQTALMKQKENRKVQLGQLLIEMGVLTDRSLKGALAQKLGIPYVSLEKFNFDPNALRLVSPSLARKHRMIPLCIHDNHLIIALENPLNVDAIEELRFTTQLKPMPAMASHDDINHAINANYGPPTAGNPFSDLVQMQLKNGEVEFYSQNDMDVSELTSKLVSEELVVEYADEPIPESDNTLVQLVNKIILDAYKEGASDIHIESYPDKQNVRVRFRKDGSLVPYLEIPANFRNAIISRIKIMSLLDISERRKPQDGKLDFQHYGPAKIELRVATIPTSNNLEDVVMRILASAKPLEITSLGLHPDYLTKLKAVMQRPYGLILVCGPTGSGKTTTLHSLLGYINTNDRKIWTAEDPIEISQPGLRQVQVNAKTGWTFAAAMRSFLRADPDVIMVGEMRDQETTKIGIEASLTGHLVVSTLHTNTAPESITRLLDLGMDPFNFADALLCVLAQRLAKTLCKECKEAYEPSATEIEELALEFAESGARKVEDIISDWEANYKPSGKYTLYKAKGCSKCNNTGYKGRIGLHELMTMNASLKRLIQRRAPVSDLLLAALDEGMYTLKQDGIMKILQGFTDISQVRSVCV